MIPCVDGLQLDHELAKVVNVLLHHFQISMLDNVYEVILALGKNIKVPFSMCVGFYQMLCQLQKILLYTKLVLRVCAVKQQVHLLQNVNEVTLEFQARIGKVSVRLNREPKRVPLSMKFSILMQPEFFFSIHF